MPAWGVGAVGAAATLLLALAVGMTVRDALRIAAIAGGSALGTGILGAGLLVALRSRPLRLQAIVVALTTVGAVAAGAAVAAEAMFLADDDLHQLFVILLAAGTAGVMVAMALGHRVLEASRSLEEATRRIARGQMPAQIERPSTAELAALGRELEAMSKRLDEARERERALEASRRELVAWVSHDLRTPLAGIRAMVEALEDGVVSDPENVARYHRTLRMEADRLAQLVDDLFELSVIQSGALHLQMDRAWLGDVVSDALATASVLAEAQGVRLEGKMDTAPEVVLSTPGISRALRNLLENAIRLTPAEGTVWVETGVEEGHAFVSVADECGGIPETVLPRVFDLAFRGEAARTPKANGSAGLGLAIAQGIVEAHRGDISVRNEGRGCRFTVRLPLFSTG
jgi:signal transduction histidine kinase